MKREIIRVEPLSTYLENWKAPIIGCDPRVRSGRGRSADHAVVHGGGASRELAAEASASLSPK